MADWLKNSRREIHDMAKQWLAVFSKTQEETKGTKAEAWGIPQSVSDKLTELADAAEAALTTAQNENTRTPVANRTCAAAFKALTGKMRDLKKRYLYIPPLTEADMIALGLKVPDSTRTESGPPTCQIVVRPFPSGGFHEIGVLLEFVKGDSKDPANKLYRIYGKIVGSGEKAPENPDELKELFSTKRLKDVAQFEFGDSGKTVYLAARAENKKNKGPWGPLSSAVIP